MRDFVARHELQGVFPQVADVSGELWARFGIRGQPAWAFVDDSGAVETAFGALTEDELDARIAALTST